MNQKPATPEAIAVGGTRPVHVWSRFTASEWSDAQDALREALPANVDNVDALSYDSPLNQHYSMVLIPRSILGVSGVTTEGQGILHWQEGIAEAFGRRQLRYGKQEGQGKQKPRFYIGFSTELSVEEKHLCYANNLYQRERYGKRPPGRAHVNSDGSQTFEYCTDLREDDELRQQQLHQLVMSRIAPQIGSIVASNVMLGLDQTSLPSLFKQKYSAV